jgi:hypothetical protein
VGKHHLGSLARILEILLLLQLGLFPHSAVWENKSVTNWFTFIGIIETNFKLFWPIYMSVYTNLVVSWEMLISRKFFKLSLLRWHDQNWRSSINFHCLCGYNVIFAFVTIPFVIFIKCLSDFKFLKTVCEVDSTQIIFVFLFF